MKQRFKKIFLLSASLCIGSTASAKVYVHLGYIDEELSPALRDILANNPSTDVLAIEADKFDKPEIFQKPRSFYTQQEAGSAPYAESQQSIGLLRDGLDALANAPSNKEAYESLALKGIPIETGAQSTFQFIIFPAKAERKSSDLIVVIKPSEFGRQPQLLTRFLRIFFGMVRNLPQAANGMSVTSLGTAGSVQPNISVGSTSNVRGSLYAGVERIGGKESSQYVGVIKYFDPLLSAEIPLWQSLPTNGVASSAAKVQEQLSKSSEVESFGNTLWNTALKARIRLLNQFGFGSSMTLSYFGSETEKSLAQGLGLTNVNMEDFHVLSEASKIADKHRIVRVISDPHAIPDWFVDSIYRWAKRERYTRQDYVEGILWRLQGLPLESTPRRAKWNIADYSSGDLSSITYQTEALNGLLDPFYVELAAKLLDDAMERRAISIESLSKKITDKLSPDAQKRLAEAIAAQSAVLAASARRIKTLYEIGTSQDSLQSQILSFIDGLSEFNLAKYPEVERDILSIVDQLDPTRKSFITSQRKLPLFSEKVGAEGYDRNHMAIWVRASKWVSKSNKLQYVAPSLPRDDFSIVGSKGFEAISLSEIATRTGDKNLEAFARVADRAIYRSSMAEAMNTQSHNQLGHDMNRIPMTIFPPRTCVQLSSQAIQNN